MDHPDVLAWRDGHIEALDQTALPHQVRTLRIGTVDELVRAITSLAIRGAPVLGAKIKKIINRKKVTKEKKLN